MEFAVDTFVSFTFPSVVSFLVQAVDELGNEMDPPFRRGSYFIEIRRKFLTYSWTHEMFFNDISELIFTHAARLDHFYADENFAKFSTRRVNENYRTFSENLAFKFPGYMLSKTKHIVPASDHVVHLDDLLGLLRSKDLDAYNRMKDHFWGPSARYTTGNSKE